MPTPIGSERFHALDALRAAMMLLGLVLHGAVSYIVTPTAAWPYFDRSRSGIFDLVVFGIHIFRMPTFFVMAGFFSALLFYRDGPRAFLAHRMRRLLLPMLAAWLVLFPLMTAGFVYAIYGGGATGLWPALAFAVSGPYQNPTLAHLWFIYYLIIFCLAAWAIVPVLGRLPLALRASVVSAFGRVMPTLGGCVLFSTVTAISLIPMEIIGLDTSIELLPAPHVLVAYAVFFVFGWLLFLRRDLVSWFGTRAWRYLAAGLAVAVVYLVCLIGETRSDAPGLRLAGIPAAALSTWLLIYGITGVFVRYFESASPVRRYLADASYWMYLTHLAVTIWMVGALAPLGMPALAKFTVVMAVTTVTTLASYHFVVRATAVGVFLNGRRFERRLPS